MRRAALCIASASLLVAVGCSRAPPERIRLGTVRLPAFGLLFIAEAKGYFAAQGLVVEQRRYPAGRDALAALAAGELDAATAFETPVAVHAATRELEVLTMLHSSRRNTLLVARADRGIARAEDLAGKRIGVPRNTHAEYFLHTLLIHGGLREGSARIVDVAPEGAVDALVAGDVDAIAIWPPLAERARRMLGPSGAVELRSEAYTEISMLVVRAATHHVRRAALAKLIRALADAERLVRERPEEAFQALRKEFADVSESELRDAWGRVDPELGITHELAAVIEREAAWLRQAGRVSGPPLDLGALLDAEILAEVDQEAVTFLAPHAPSGGGAARWR